MGDDSIDMVILEIDMGYLVTLLLTSTSTVFIPETTRRIPMNRSRETEKWTSVNPWPPVSPTPLALGLRMRRLERTGRVQRKRYLSR